MPDAPEFSRLARLRNLAQTAWTLAAGRICGAAIGAMAGWYGALAGFAMGAMLDAARRRRQLPESLESETVAGSEQASAVHGAAKLEPSKAVLKRAADMLGVSIEADRAAIKRAFWRISRASHPDGPDPDPERFMAAKQAAEALLGRPD